MAPNEDSSMTSTTPPIPDDGPSTERCHAVAGQMTYYIYENWQAGPHKAKIHQSSCGHCNGGLGRTQIWERRTCASTPSKRPPVSR